MTPDYAGVTAFAGGVGTLYSSLAPALAQLISQVDVIAPTYDEPRVVVQNQVTARLVHASRGSAHSLTFARGAARILEEQRFDCVLASEYGAGAAAYTRRGAAPVITHLHTSTAQAKALSNWPIGRRLHPSTLLRMHLERRQTERSAALIASSRSIYRWTTEMWDIANLPCRVLPNAVPVDHLRELSQGSLPAGFPGAGPIIAFPGRLEVRKGVHVLAQAFTAVAEQLPDAQLVLIGPDDGYKRGWMSQHLRELAGAHWKSVHLLGLQPPERLMPALAAADLVVLPSLWENYSLSALETLSLCRPLIVTSGNGFDELVTAEESALVVPPGEPEPLSRAILRLLGDSSLRQRLAKGAGEVADSHRPEPVARRYVDYLEEVVLGSNRASAGRPGSRRATTR